MYLGKDNVCAGEGGKRKENSYTKIPWAAVREVFHGGLDPGRALMSAYHYGGSLIIKKKESEARPSSKRDWLEDEETTRETSQERSLMDESGSGRVECEGSLRGEAVGSGRDEGEGLGVGVYDESGGGKDKGLNGREDKGLGGVSEGVREGRGLRDVGGMQMYCHCYTDTIKSTKITSWTRCRLSP